MNRGGKQSSPTATAATGYRQRRADTQRSINWLPSFIQKLAEGIRFSTLLRIYTIKFYRYHIFIAVITTKNVKLLRPSRSLTNFIDIPAVARCYSHWYEHKLQPIPLKDNATTYKIENYQNRFNNYPPNTKLLRNTL